MNILLCTVGGSHQPILRAIQESHADFVCFICSRKDLATGKAGSDLQISGKGLIIKASHTDEKPSLPNIPTQCGLPAEAYEVLPVSADDLDQVYTACRHALLDLHQRYPQAKLHADYTGGTKTMSAGLILAAVEDEQVELQLVTGGRVDLVRVRDGYEKAAPANIEVIRLQQTMQPYLQAWTRYAYTEAEAGLCALPASRSSALRGQVDRARGFSAAFAAWDRFDHAGAMGWLQDFAATLPPDLAPLLGILRSLTEHDVCKRQAAQLLDLYRNAERRAIQGRYDDAVARLYRLLEWTAQWLLEQHCQVKTSDLPENFAPHIPPGRDGKRQAGLFEAWRLVAAKTPGPMAAFSRDQGDYLLDHLRARNGSILAHGFEPIGKDVWHAFHTWVEKSFLPVLLEETARVGIRNMPPQLPDRYPCSHISV